MNKFNGFQKGVNIGGWLSQCVHTNEHYDSFICEEDIKLISLWGADHIRVPIDYVVIESKANKFINEGFKYIDCCIEWCAKYNLNFVLDIHKAAGFNFEEAIEGDYTKCDAFFADNDLLDRFVALWVEIAKRYGKYYDRVAFELINEIVETNNGKSWNKLANRLIHEIRTEAPYSKIIIGGIFWNNVDSVKLLDSPFDDNIVFNFHFYEPMLLTHQRAHWMISMPKDKEYNYPSTVDIYKKSSKYLGYFGDKVLRYNGNLININFLEKLILEAVHVAEKYNVPLYCGEYGVIDCAPLESSLNWYKDMHMIFEKHNIGRAIWTYKLMDFGITQEHYQPILDKIIAIL